MAQIRIDKYLADMGIGTRSEVKNRPFGYARLSVELLPSPAADCMIHCSGPYSLLQWTVQSIADRKSVV